MDLLANNRNVYVFESVELSTGVLAVGATLQFDARWEKTLQLVPFTTASGLTWPQNAIEDPDFLGSFLVTIDGNDLSQLGRGRQVRIRIYREEAPGVEPIERIIVVDVANYIVE